MIAGRNPVIEALKSGREINKIWINERARGGQMNELIQLAKQKRTLIQFVPKQKLDRLTDGANHQGVAASVAAYQYATVDELFLRAQSRKEPPFFLLLDELEDPHNFGSILRTADAAGVHGVIIPKRRSVSLTAAVAKASTGAIEYVSVARVNNLAQTVDHLKKRGLWLVAAEATAPQSFHEIDYDMPLCLIIGSEGKGIRRVLKQKSDFLVKFPMAGKVTSLNASVAAALLMYEVYLTRLKLRE